MRYLSRCFAVVALLVLVGGCGGDDAADTATTTTAAAAGATTTRTAAAGATAAATGKLPDACGLIDDATASTALGGTATLVPPITKTQPQPATDASSRCEWKGSGPYSLSLLIQRGTTAKSSFDNTVSGGFAAPAVTLAGIDTRLRLGAHETSRNYRLVSVAGYNGTYYVYFTIQGVDRADTVATDIATGLVRTVVSKLPT